MADVEINRHQEGRVASGQIMTPRASPDEAREIAGDEKHDKNDSTGGVASPINHDKENPTVTNVTADYDDDEEDNTVMNNAATSPAISTATATTQESTDHSATVNNEDADMAEATTAGHISSSKESDERAHSAEMADTTNPEVSLFSSVFPNSFQDDLTSKPSNEPCHMWFFPC